MSISNTFLQNSFVQISPIKTKERKEYYRKNALKAYKNDIRGFTDENTSFEENDRNISYSEINEFLQKYNVDSQGNLMILNKTYKKDKKHLQNILEIIKTIDGLMKNIPLYYIDTGGMKSILKDVSSKEKVFYKGITHVHKTTLDSNTPIIYNAYNSISKNYHTALSFAKKSVKDYDFNILLCIIVNKDDKETFGSINVSDYIYSDDEAEIILERNTKFTNFQYKEFDEKNKVYIYTTIVSKYTPTPLFLPSSNYKKFSLELQQMNTKFENKKVMTLFDINRTKRSGEKFDFDT